MIRLALADDHAIVRQGIRAILAEASGLRVVIEAAGGDELLERVTAVEVDVILMDISMPGPGLLELLRGVQERRPRARVIVLSGHAEEQFAVRALRAGAAGYVTKERSAEDLVAAIRQVARGGRYVSAHLAQLLAAEAAGDPAQAAHDALSAREFEVLRLLGAGRSVKEAAADLGVSPKTVSTYRQRLLEKMQLRSTAALIRYAVEHGLLD